MCYDLRAANIPELFSYRAGHSVWESDSISCDQSWEDHERNASIVLETGNYWLCCEDRRALLLARLYSRMFQLHFWNQTILKVTTMVYLLQKSVSMLGEEIQLYRLLNVFDETVFKKKCSCVEEHKWSISSSLDSLDKQLQRRPR